jgi:hypothetical protein
VRAVQRVGRRRHRLDADVVGPGRREHLRNRKALGVLHRDRPPGASDLEPPGGVDAVKAVVPGALANRTGERLGRLGGAGGDHLLVEQQVAANRE